jgi:hypothetical protein
VRVAVEGTDGSQAAGSAQFRVLSPGPAVRLTRAPRRARVGRPVKFAFRVKDALSEVAEVSTADGMSTRRYRIRSGTGFLNWTPAAAGRAEVRVSVRGRDGQTASDTAKLTVAPAPRAKPRAGAPGVTLVGVPRRATVGRASEIAFNVGEAGSAIARITGDDGEAHVWFFDRAAGRQTFRWTPARAGDYRLTISAQARGGTTAQTTMPLSAAPTR